MATFKSVLYCLFFFAAISAYVILFFTSLMEINESKRYKSDGSKCDRDAAATGAIATVALKYWVYIDGLVTVLAINLILVGVGTAMWSGLMARRTGGIAIFLFCCFSIGWIIPGCVYLARYPVVCRVAHRDMWHAVLSAIIIRWIYIVINGVFGFIALMHKFNYCCGSASADEESGL